MDWSAEPLWYPPFAATAGSSTVCGLQLVVFEKVREAGFAPYTRHEYSTTMTWKSLENGQFRAQRLKWSSRQNGGLGPVRY